MSGPRVLVPLADGCEELEAVTVVDLLRRAGLEVVTAGLADGTVTASRGTRLVPDTTLGALEGESFDAIVLPGGQPGADHLAADERVAARLRAMHADGDWVCAICAAPGVLARAGVLEGHRATAFPGVLERLGHGTLEHAPVVRDRNVVTSRGPGTAMDFALELVGLWCGEEARGRVEGALQRP